MGVALAETPSVYGGTALQGHQGISAPVPLSISRRGAPAVPPKFQPYRRRIKAFPRENAIAVHLVRVEVGERGEDPLACATAVLRPFELHAANAIHAGIACRLRGPENFPSQNSAHLADTERE